MYLIPPSYLPTMSYSKFNNRRFVTSLTFRGHAARSPSFFNKKRRLDCNYKTNDLMSVDYLDTTTMISHTLSLASNRRNRISGGVPQLALYHSSPPVTLLESHRLMKLPPHAFCYTATRKITALVPDPRQRRGRHLIKLSHQLNAASLFFNSISNTLHPNRIVRKKTSYHNIVPPT